MDEVWDLVRLLLPTAFGLAMGWLAGKKRTHDADVKRLEEKQDANNKATMCLVRKTLIDAYDLFVRHSAPMTVERRHEITALYEAYKGLNGNGVVDHLYEELAAQPTIIVNSHGIPEEGEDL